MTYMGVIFPYSSNGYLTSSYPFSHIQKSMILELDGIILPLRLFER